MNEWLESRKALVAELSGLICAGFEAASRYDAESFAGLVDRQEEVCRRLALHDRQQPAWPAGTVDVAEVATELQTMNDELRHLSMALAALIERGGRSARCFQRVLAMGAPAYEPPAPS